MKRKIKNLVTKKLESTVRAIKPICFYTTIDYQNYSPHNNIRLLRSNANNSNRPTINCSLKKPINSCHSEKFDVSINPHDILDNYQVDSENKWLVNISSHHLPLHIIDLLRLGPDFSLPLCKNDKSIAFEVIKDVENNIRNLNILTRESIRSNIVPILQRFSDHSNPYPANEKNHLLELQNKNFLVRRFMRDNKDILFTRADKGSITVVIDKNDYIKKIGLALGDSNTSTRVKLNPVKKTERDLNSLIKNWRLKKYTG